MSQGGRKIWTSEAWRSLATSWIDRQLAAASMERTGEVEPSHVRPWAAVLRVPIRGGQVWFKASGASTAFEIGLYDLLQRVVPEHVLEPIAMDLDRAWILLPDGGPLLGDGLPRERTADAFADILPQYAELQRALAPHADAMVALGVADMRAPLLPQRFDEAVAFSGAFVARRGTDAQREQFERVIGLRETFTARCARLAQAPAPASLDHNDLHPWNVLTAGPGAPAKFYDWGDGVIAHAFACMLVPLSVLVHRLETTAADVRILRARDAYLEVFRDCAPHAELVETLELACHLGRVARSLTWARAVKAMSDADDDPDDFASAPLEAMLKLLEDDFSRSP